MLEGAGEESIFSNKYTWNLSVSTSPYSALLISSPSPEVFNRSNCSSADSMFLIDLWISFGCSLAFPQCHLCVPLSLSLALTHTSNTGISAHTQEQYMLHTSYFTPQTGIPFLSERRAVRDLVVASLSAGVPQGKLSRPQVSSSSVLKSLERVPAPDGRIWPLSAAKKDTSYCKCIACSPKGMGCGAYGNDGGGWR